MDDKEFLKKIGHKIKILRTIRGYSQDDIVNFINVDKSYYSKVERGLTNVTLTYLKHLADFLGVELSELVDVNIKI